MYLALNELVIAVLYFSTKLKKKQHENMELKFQFRRRMLSESELNVKEL